MWSANRAGYTCHPPILRHVVSRSLFMFMLPFYNHDVSTQDREAYRFPPTLRSRCRDCGKAAKSGIGMACRSPDVVAPD